MLRFVDGDACDDLRLELDVCCDVGDGGFELCVGVLEGWNACCDGWVVDKVFEYDAVHIQFCFVSCCHCSIFLIVKKIFLYGMFCSLLTVVAGDAMPRVSTSFVLCIVFITTKVGGLLCIVVKKLDFFCDFFWNVEERGKIVVDFLTVRLHFLTVRLHFLTVRVRFLTVRVRFLTVRVRFLTVRVHFLTVRVHFLTVRVHFLTVRVRFFGVIVDFFGVIVDFLTISVNFSTASVYFCLASV